MPNLTYNKDQFLLDGKPFTIISGTIHYFRVVPEYWEDRLKKLKACGFNTEGIVAAQLDVIVLQQP